jgi:hypothetical protein
MPRLEAVVCLFALLVTASTRDACVAPGVVQVQALHEGVWIDVGGLAAQLSDNAFDMIGGESVTVHITTTASPAKLRKVLRVRSYYSSAT